MTQHDETLIELQKRLLKPQDPADANQKVAEIEEILKSSANANDALNQITDVIFP